MRKRSGSIPWRKGSRAKSDEKKRVNSGLTYGVVPTFFNSSATVFANTFYDAFFAINPSPSGLGSGTRSFL